MPSVIVAPIAGVFVDRFDRRRVILISIAAQGAVALSLTSLLVANLLALPLILLLVFLLNAAAQFPRAATPALLPCLVATDDLMTANSLYSFSSSSNRLVSLSLGGVVVALFGVAVPIYYDAATFWVAVLLISLITGSYTALSARDPDPAGSVPRPGILAELTEAIRFVRTDRILAQLLVLGLAVNVVGGIFLALLAPYARITLHGAAYLYGFLLAAIAVGSIGGAALLGHFPVRRLVGRLLFAGVAATGATIAALGFTTAPSVALAVAAGSGAAITVANLPLGTLFQVRVPDRLRGRALGTVFAVLAAPQPIGAILGGSLGGSFGVRHMLVVSGLAVVGLVVLLALLLPELRSASY